MTEDEEEELLDLLDDPFKHEVHNKGRRGDFRRWRPRELSAISPCNSPTRRAGSIHNLRRAIARAASTSAICAGGEAGRASAVSTAKCPIGSLQKEVINANTRSRVAKAKPPVHPRSPHALRTVALGPIKKSEDEMQATLRDAGSFTKPCASLIDLERCSGYVQKLPTCEEPKGLTGESFKEAFEKRCRSKTVLRDPWKGLPNPELTRAPSEFDLTLNQVWPQSPVAIGLDLDLETVVKVSRAPNKNHWSWRGGADVYVRPCSSAASTRASTRPNSLASTRHNSPEARSGSASRNSSIGPRRRSLGNREDSVQSASRRSVLVVEPRLTKAARRRTL